MNTTDYSTVTESMGDWVSPEAFAMARERHTFVMRWAEGKRLLEISCGIGQGLGLAAGRAAVVVGSDLTARSLASAKAHYRSRIPLVRCDAHALPFRDGSFDVCAMQESIYYYSDAPTAFREAHRVLRSGGTLCISTINPEWSDFNPSAFSTRYWTAVDLASHLRSLFSSVELFGAFPVAAAHITQRLMSAAKRVAMTCGLIPKTMKGKRFLKRLVFGQLTKMPSELAIADEPLNCVPLSQTDSNAAHFKVIYVAAHRA